MNTAVRPHFETARHIARQTDNPIKKQNGAALSLMVCPPEAKQKTPQDMMQKIATILHMSPECYQLKIRQRDLVDLRFIAAHLLRRYFPRITLHAIAYYFGGQDHSTIINALRKTDDLLQSNDLCFTAKYYHVSRVVNEWIKE
jgi:chromosomal replication initiation ATPase DnaA